MDALKFKLTLMELGITLDEFLDLKDAWYQLSHVDQNNLIKEEYWLSGGQ